MAAKVKSRILSASFYDRPTLEVANDLLGKMLCRRIENRVVKMPLTEVEAYDGFDDKASHAHRGMTARNAVMFGPSGHWYVYLSYGVHWLLNMVTGPEDYPAAILIRGAGEFQGPGRLTRALQIDNRFNARCADGKSGLWIEDCGFTTDADEIQRTPRIGVNYAGRWSHKPYRFVLRSLDSKRIK